MQAGGLFLFAPQVEHDRGAKSEGAQGHQSACKADTASARLLPVSAD
jgi:hypothetical protein